MATELKSQLDTVLALLAKPVNGEAIDGEVVIAALNLLLEHGPAIRAAVGGEAFEFEEGDRMTLRCALVSFSEDLKRDGLGSDVHGVKMTAAYLARIPRLLRRIDSPHQLYASPPATVDVGALRELAEKWRASLEGDYGLYTPRSMLEQCADELAALIGGKV